MYEKEGFVYYDSGDFAGYIYRYKGSEKDLIIPDGTKGIDTIAEYRNEYKLDINSIHIPKSVERVCNLKYLNVKKVIVEGDNVYFDEFAFEKCTELSSLEIKGQNPHFCVGVLYGCDSLADSNGFISYDKTLYGCTNEGPKICIPDGIEVISDRALFIIKRNGNVFKEFNLEEVILPDSVKDIHQYAFINSEDADPDVGTGEKISSMIPRKMPKKMNIPNGYLKQLKGSFDSSMVPYLLAGPWKNLATEEDFACLLLNQHSKRITEYCYKIFSDKNVYDYLVEVQNKYNFKTGLNAIAEWVIANKKQVSANQIENLKKIISTSKDKKAQKLIDKL